MGSILKNKNNYQPRILYPPKMSFKNNARNIRECPSGIRKVISDEMWSNKKK